MAPLVPIAPLAREPIAEAANGEDVLRVRRIALELLTQRCHVDIDRARVRKLVVRAFGEPSVPHSLTVLVLGCGGRFRGGWHAGEAAPLVLDP